MLNAKDVMKQNRSMGKGVWTGAAVAAVAILIALVWIRNLAPKSSGSHDASTETREPVSKTPVTQ